MSRTIKASQVREGMQVSAVTVKATVGFLCRTRNQVRPLRKQRGQWPTVTDVSLGKVGRDTEIYLTLSDDPGACYVLTPGSLVTVEGAS